MYPIKLRNGMLKHINITFLNTVFEIYVGVPLNKKCCLNVHSVLSMPIISKQSLERFGC